MRHLLLYESLFPSSKTRWGFRRLPFASMARGSSSHGCLGVSPAVDRGSAKMMSCYPIIQPLLLSYCPGSGSSSYSARVLSQCGIAKRALYSRPGMRKLRITYPSMTDSVRSKLLGCRKWGLSPLPLHSATLVRFRPLSHTNGHLSAPFYSKEVTESLKVLLHKKEMAFISLANTYAEQRHRSYRYAERCLWATWGLLAVLLLLLFIGTYHVYSWNVIEPITYLFSLLLIWVCLLWYKRYGNEFSFAMFRRRVAERHFIRQQVPHVFFRRYGATDEAMTRMPYRTMDDAEREIRVLVREIHSLRKQIRHSITVQQSYTKKFE